MSELPSIKIKHILPTGEFDEDEYTLKSVAEAALAEKDARIKELEEVLREINRRAEAVFFHKNYDPYLTEEVCKLSKAVLEAK